jgi:large repetitive protein
MRVSNPVRLNKKRAAIAAAFVCILIFVQVNTVSAQCAIPAVYNVTGGGAYCQGNPGVFIGLDKSDEGVSYQLMQNTNEVGDPVAGTGTAISLGTSTIAGIYTIVATVSGEGCSSDMDGSAVVTVNQSPTVTIAADGPTIFCNGGAVTLAAPGGGNALQFNGVNNYVSIPNPVTEVFTIEAWIKTSANSFFGENAYEGNGIIWSDVGGGANDFTIAILNNRLSFFDGAGDFGTNGSIILNDGKWHHIAVVRDGRNAYTSLFVDGIPDGSNNADNVALNDNSNISIGGNTLDERYFEGSVDEVRIWNIARTQAEIQANMHAIISGTSSALSAYYKFDETTGTIASDASGNGNTGTLQNAPARVLSTASLMAFSNYLWSNGDTTSNIHATVSGNYTVSVTDSNGCMATSDVRTVTVNPLPATPYVTASGPVSFCTGDSVILTSSASLLNQWYRNGVLISGRKQNKTINRTGVVTISTANTSGCRSEQSAPVSVTVNPLPAKPVITVTLGTFCAGGKATLTIKKATVYQWYKDGTLISGATTRTYQTNAAGSYTVTVTNAKGCQNTSNAAVLLCASAAMANINTLQQLTSVVSPNPAMSDFTLLLQSGDRKTPVAIIVVDMYGKCVYEIKGMANQQYKFGQNFSPGSYMLRIMQGGEIKTTKIIKLK